MLSGTRVVAKAPARGELLLEDDEVGWRLKWKKLILCTGAHELLLPFPGWTLPGVTGAGALQALIKGGMPVAGERIVIAGSGPLLLAAAATAAEAGARVLRVAEQARLADVIGFGVQLGRWPGKAWQALGLLRAGFRTGRHVVVAKGGQRVSSARLQQANGQVEEFACDRLACGFGLVPNTELGRMLGCAVTPQASGGLALNVTDGQATSVPGIYAAGECTGVGGSERALVQGAIAGHMAVGRTMAAQALSPVTGAMEHLRRAIAPSLRAGRRPAPTGPARNPRVSMRRRAAVRDRRAQRLDPMLLYTRCGMGVAARAGSVARRRTSRSAGRRPRPARR